jgi:hypothetical protein
MGDDVLTGVKIRLNTASADTATAIAQIGGVCQSVSTSQFQLLITGLVPELGSAVDTSLIGTGASAQISLTCPAGHAVAGLTGHLGNGGAGPIEQLGLTCLRLLSVNTQNGSLAGILNTTSGITFNNTTAGAPLCPSGRVAIGLRGNIITGNPSRLERVGLNCR